MPGDVENAYEALPGIESKSKLRTKGKRVCFFLIASLLAVLAAVLVLPTIIVGSRARKVKVQIVGGTVQVRSDKCEVLNPKAHILADRSLLQFMAVPYEAHVQPFTAMVYLNLPNGSTSSTKKLGEMEIMKLVWDSRQTYNHTVEGKFKVTAPIEDLAIVVNEFFQKPSLKSHTKATVSMVSILWGWIPMYFPYIHLEYELAVPGMNSFFETHPVQVAIPSSVEGYPEHMEVGASAEIYYPSPIGVQLDTSLTLRVSFLFQGQNHTIGLAKLQPLQMKHGMNNVSGNFSIIQTASNAGALEELFSLYVSEQNQTKSDPCIFLNIHGAGNDTSSSELLRKAFELIQLRVGFLAPKFDLLEAVSADLVLIGSLFSQNHDLYRVTMNLKMRNPLPQRVALTGMHIKSYQDDLNGDNVCDAIRDLDPHRYSVPALAEDYYVSLPLRLLEFQEVDMTLNSDDMGWLFQGGEEKHTSMGVVVQATVSISPGGFVQTVRYTRNQMGVSMCYHMSQPALPCGEHANKGIEFTNQSMMLH